MVSFIIGVVIKKGDVKMNIILGATGQVGSMLAEELLRREEPVRVVVRNETKAQTLKNMGAEVAIADYFDVESLKKAFQGGKTVFLLTPENPESDHFLQDTKALLNNYREAILSTDIRKIVGLSSMGAQNGRGTGSLLASHYLERAFQGINREQIFVRPAYYFSNWVGYMELVKEQGVLPTFFPIEMKLPMIAPQDVAKFLAEVIVNAQSQEKIIEITGPQPYSSLEIAKSFEEVLNRKVTLQQIVPADWEEALLSVGFSKDGTENLMQMTQAVIDGKTQTETSHVRTLATDFKTYLKTK